uniref:WW domain-containing oxidoreductase n=2 Tax=Hirondellea gigas TaxID=1518452 RepID=A0A6A7FS96_9CRUS
MELPETDSEDELAPGWEERCTLNGEVFYAHHGSKSTQWTHPRTGKKKTVSGALPLGWERQHDDDGSVKFVHRETGRETYTDPRLAFAVEETTGLHDLRQRFDASSTGLQVLHGRDLSGQVAIVTGANSGIGYETARTFAFHGCTVVLACRDVERGRAAMARIKKQRPFADCHVLRLELSSLASVKRFAQDVVTAFKGVHILVLNAGAFNAPHQLTEDGMESTYQVNHLSHFYLAQLLLTTMQACDARIVWLSAESHRFASMTHSDDICEAVLSPASRKSFVPILAYNNSKLCNLLAAFELQRRFGYYGISSYAVHPGNVVSTGLVRNSWLYSALFALVRPWSKSLQQACASSVYCACSPDVARCGGVYVNGCMPCMPSRQSLDPVLAYRLYNLNIRLIESIMGSTAFTLLRSARGAAETNLRLSTKLI